MLFTDQNAVDANGLNVTDPEFLSVALAEGITVDSSPDSFITFSCEAAGSFLLSNFQNFSGYLVGTATGSNQLAAVLNILSTAINRPRAWLDQMPVLEPNPQRKHLFRWIKYYVLHDFYRALDSRRDKSRYEKKMLLYADEKKKHWEILKNNGFPIVINPLAAPGATGQYGAGTWGVANLSETAGGAQASTINYDVSITWCSLPAYVNGANQNGAESGGSSKATISVDASKVIHISIASLNPPTTNIFPAIGTADGLYPPMAATHWNVYIRTTPASGTTPLFLQNAAPIPIATTTYTLADVPTTTGFQQNAGQPAQYNFAPQTNMLWRG